MIVFRIIYITFLIWLIVGFFSCDSARQAQKKWDSGIRKNETLFISNSQKLAKLYYKDFASFCAEYYPAILKNDSTDYLKARREYELLKAKYESDMKDLQGKIDSLDILIKAGEDSGNDSLTIISLKEKLRLLQEQKQKSEPIQMSPIVQQVADSALITAHQAINDSLNERTMQRDAFERRILQLEDEKSGKVMLPWWSLLIAGSVFAAGVILYIKK